jgi:hypothetical protein
MDLLQLRKRSQTDKFFSLFLDEFKPRRRRRATSLSHSLSPSSLSFERTRLALIAG